MPKTKLEIKKWLMEDMGFSEQGITDQKLVEAFTPRLDKLEGAVMRQQDYDRVMNEHKVAIKTQQDELQAAQTRLDAEVAEWATVQANNGKITEKMRTDFEAAQADVLKLQQVLQRTATATGLNYDDLVKGIEVKTPVAAPPPVAAVDTSKFVSVDQYQALSRMALQVPAQLDRIQREHFELTGEYINPEELTAEVMTRAGDKHNKKSLELRDIWEEKYSIPEKRTAKAKEAHDAEISAAEQRGREAAMSEASLPGGAPPGVGHHSPVFKATHTPALQRPQAGLPNQSAVSALRTGKYRQAPPAGAPAAK
jgi:hypothetical protein